MTLTLRNVSVTLGGARVLTGIDATFTGGTLIGVIGPNGAGKSTLARAIIGVQRCSGDVMIDGIPVAAMPPADRARRLAYLPQGQAVHWPLSVERLVALGRLPHLAPFSRLAAPDRAAIDRAMAETDIAHLATRDATTLSGGERARALLARALAVEAPLLVADEPLAALDPAHQLAILTLLRARARAGALVIAVLHDLTLAARFCDRLLLLNEGRRVADDTPRAVLTPERLVAVYGVTVDVVDHRGELLVVPITPR